MKSIVLKFFLLFICFALGSSSFIPPPPGNECKAPNGEKGLGTTLREIIDLIPFPKIFGIYIRAVSNDPEVEAAMEYIESEEFKRIIQTIHDTKQFSDFMEFLCEEVYFDSYFYLNSLGKILDYPLMTRPPHHRMARNIPQNRVRAGFEGFLQDIKDALPLEQMKQVYKKHYDTDKYLKLAVEKIGSSEFQKIIDNIHSLPEHQRLLQRLKNLHVDYDKILGNINAFFGWNFHPM